MGEVGHPEPIWDTSAFLFSGVHAPRAPSENMHVAINIATCVVTKCIPRDMIAHLTAHCTRTRPRRLFPSFCEYSRVWSVFCTVRRSPC